MMVGKSRSWGSIAVLTVSSALVWGVDGGILWPRGGSTKNSKQISDDICIDLDNSNPPPLRFGYPSWATSSENPNCATAYEVDRTGQCITHMSPENGCNSFCQQSNGWMFGEPLDAMDGRWCEVGQACAKTISISKTTGDSMTVNSGESYSDDTTRTNSTDIKIGMDIKSGMSAKHETEISAGNDTTNVKHKQSFSVDFSLSSTFSTARSESWSRSMKESKTYGVTNQSTFAINIAESDSLTRPAWSTNYCGSWYAVPIVGVSCGRGARGRFAINKANQTSVCVLQDQEEDVFSHCFQYTFTDSRSPDMTKYRWAFVLRDCRFGTILPGEWQPYNFQNSFSPLIYARQHIERYGYNNLPKDWPKKPDDADWASDDIPMAHTKILGPEDHTIKLCGPHGWCARHKLTDNNCLNLPRGHAGVKSVDIVEAHTTPGNCCTLFSRHECHGHAQNVRGSITDFKSVGFASQAHSVICNVDKYCNPDVSEELLDS